MLDTVAVAFKYFDAGAAQEHLQPVFDALMKSGRYVEFAQFALAAAGNLTAVGAVWKHEA